MMKKFFLLVFSFLSLIGLTAWRTYLLGNCIDSFNGFFLAEHSMQRLIFAAVLAVVLIAIAIFVSTDKKMPGSPRRSSKTIAFINLVYAFFILADSLTLINKLETPWEIINLGLLLLLAVFMIYYAICMFTYRKPSSIISILPLIYFVYKLCYVFINSFGIIKSSEVTLKIVALIFCVLFFEFFARYISKVTFKKVRKVTLFAGIGACISCVIASAPDFIAPLIYSDVSLRLSLSESLFFCITALYIAVFLLSSYSKRELYNDFAEQEEEVIISETIDL